MESLQQASRHDLSVTRLDGDLTSLATSPTASDIEPPSETAPIADRLGSSQSRSSNSLLGSPNRPRPGTAGGCSAVKHDQWDYHLHATPSLAPLATQMAVDAAMAFVDVVRGQELSRLRICAADDCDNAVVDLSKNRSKRYCDGGCGNRVAVAAYRARKAKTGIRGSSLLPHSSTLD